MTTPTTRQQISTLRVFLNANARAAQDQTVTIAYDPDAISDPTQRISDTSTTETNPNYLLGFVEAIQNNSTQQLTDTTPARLAAASSSTDGQTLTLLL